MSKPFIHPHALVESQNIGDNTRVWAFSHILPNANIGIGCNICDHTFIENDVIIGNDVTVKCGIYIWDGIRIEDKVFLGPNVVFTNDLRPRSKVHTTEIEETLIRYGASIGANATIIAGNTIGKWSMIGAGAVVTKDIPNHALAYGNPARVVGYVCECAKDLKFKRNLATCVCGKQYISDNGAVMEIQ